MNEKEKVQITAMTAEQLADKLRASGSKTVTADAIRAMIADGAPTNPDGTISIIKFTAYLEGRNNGSIQ